jgi:thiamine biosynthesis lipoprotein
LDLGATGKAFAADLVAGAVAEQLGCAVIVSLGGDVSAVTNDTRTGWQVLVSDTEGGDLEAPGQVVTLRTGGIATSSTRHRRWRHEDETVHHILDPRTGRPAAAVLASATVSAATCVEANGASTAAIILGDRAATWLEDRNLPSLLVGTDGVAARCAGWPLPQEVGVLC